MTYRSFTRLGLRAYWLIRRLIKNLFMMNCYPCLIKSCRQRIPRFWDRFFVLLLLSVFAKFSMYCCKRQLKAMIFVSILINMLLRVNHILFVLNTIFKLRMFLLLLKDLFMMILLSLSYSIMETIEFLVSETDHHLLVNNCTCPA